MHITRYTFVSEEMVSIKLQTFLFSVSPHSVAATTWLASLKSSCAIEQVLQYIMNHADAAHFETWRQYKFSLYLSSSSDSSRSSSSWESSASSDGPSSDIIRREDPRLFTDNVITLLGNSPRSAACTGYPFFSLQSDDTLEGEGELDCFILDW